LHTPGYFTASLSLLSLALSKRALPRALFRLELLPGIYPGGGANNGGGGRFIVLTPPAGGGPKVTDPLNSGVSFTLLLPSPDPAVFPLFTASGFGRGGGLGPAGGGGRLLGEKLRMVGFTLLRSTAAGSPVAAGAVVVGRVLVGLVLIGRAMAAGGGSESDAACERSAKDFAASDTRLPHKLTRGWRFDVCRRRGQFAQIQHGGLHSVFDTT
jgi:hypothetical protein